MLGCGRYVSSYEFTWNRYQLLFGVPLVWYLGLPLGTLRCPKLCRGTPCLAIIAPIADAADDACVACLRAGMDGFITKPVDPRTCAKSPAVDPRSDWCTTLDRGRFRVGRRRRLPPTQAFVDQILQRDQHPQTHECARR